MVDSKGEKDRKETKAWRKKLSALGKKNVGKGSSGGYFPTFRKAGSTVRAAGVKAAPHVKKVAVAGAAGVGGAAGYVAGKAKKAGSAGIEAVSGMGPYYWLLFFSVVDLAAKNFVAYEKISSSVISFFTALIFYILIRKTPEAKFKETLIIGALILDIGLTFGLLKIPLGSIVEGPLIAFHVFIWVGLAGILFSMGISDTLGAGRKLPRSTWIILIVFIAILIPLLPTSYLYQNDIRQSDYFEIAMEEIEEIGITLEKTTNFWYDYFGCLGNFITEPDKDFEDCLEDKRITRFCKANFDEDQQKGCIAAEKKKLSGEEGYVRGAVSDIIKKVFTAKLTVPEGLFPKRPAERRRDYPVDLIIENQRELEGIIVEASCVFTKRKEKILGEISVSGKDGSIFEITESIDSFRINCKPSVDLELGTYKVNYKVVLHGLSTPSFLERVIVRKDLSEDKELMKQINNDYFRSRDDRSSQAPKDPARMNFAFGNPHPERRGELNPIIMSDEVIPFVTTFENVGRGKIIAVNSYSAETFLEMGFGIAKGEFDCLEFSGVPISVPVSREYVHKSCDLELPENLKNMQVKYKFITFKLDFNYDYELKEEESTTIIEVLGEEETEEEPEAIA